MLVIKIKRENSQEFQEEKIVFKDEKETDF
jgi:hypothetical protein